MAPIVPFLTDTSRPFDQLLAAEQTSQSVQAWIHERKDVIHALKKQALDQEVLLDIVCEDIQQLEREISGYKRLLQSNEVSRSHWRRKHMGACRATMRPLKVVDLPSEILTMIFAHFEDVPVDQFKPTFDEPPELSPDVATIKSIRLTCRAFCNSGSRFLIPIVDTSFTQSSLQRLEDISSHPLFSKGVQILRIHPNRYNSLLVNDRNNFMGATSRRLSKLCMKFQDDAERTLQEVSEACRLVGVVPEPHLLRNREFAFTLMKAYRFMNMLDHIVRRGWLHGPPTLFEYRINNAIDQTHEEYRRRYLEQQNLINDSEVLTRIVAAVRQMPSVEELCIPNPGDHNSNNIFSTGWDKRGDVPKFKASMVNNNPFWDLMIQDGEREDAEIEWDEDRPFPLLYKLPSMLQAANGNLTTIDIHLPPIRSHHIEADHLANLQRSCQNLEAIRITVIETPWTLGPDGVGSLTTTYTILGAMLVSPRLEYICLGYQWRGIGTSLVDHTSSIGPVIANLPWSKIQSFQLQGFPIKVDELRQVVEKVQGKITWGFASVYLLRGSWGKVLDILRGRADTSSHILDPRGSRMRGKSPRTLRYYRSEFDSEHRDGWYSNNRCPGTVTHYIRGGNIANPLRRRGD